MAEVPQNLLAQVKVGGRLLAVVGEDPVMCATLITRLSETEFKTRALWDSAAPALQNFPVPSHFQF